MQKRRENIRLRIKLIFHRISVVFHELVDLRSGVIEGFFHVFFTGNCHVELETQDFFYLGPFRQSGAVVYAVGQTVDFRVVDDVEIGIFLYQSGVSYGAETEGNAGSTGNVDPLLVGFSAGEPIS